MNYFSYLLKKFLLVFLVFHALSFGSYLFSMHGVGAGAGVQTTEQGIQDFKEFIRTECHRILSENPVKFKKYLKKFEGSRTLEKAEKSLQNRLEQELDQLINATDFGAISKETFIEKIGNICNGHNQETLGKKLVHVLQSSWQDYDVKFSVHEEKKAVTAEAPKTPERPKWSSGLSSVWSSSPQQRALQQVGINLTPDRLRIQPTGATLPSLPPSALSRIKKQLFSGDGHGVDEVDETDTKRSLPFGHTPTGSPKKESKSPKKPSTSVSGLCAEPRVLSACDYMTPPGSPIRTGMPYMTPPRTSDDFETTTAIIERFIKNIIRLGDSEVKNPAFKSFSSLINMMFTCTDYKNIGLNDFAKDGELNSIILAIMFQNPEALQAFIAKVRAASASKSEPEELCVAEVLTQIFTEDIPRLDSDTKAKAFFFKGKSIDRVTKIFADAKAGKQHKDLSKALKRLITILRTIEQGHYANTLFLSLFEYYYQKKYSRAPSDRADYMIGMILEALRELKLYHFVHVDNICAPGQTGKNMRRALCAEIDHDMETCAILMAVLCIQDKTRSKINISCLAKKDGSPTKEQCLKILESEAKAFSTSFDECKVNLLLCPQDTHSGIIYCKQSYGNAIRSAIESEVVSKLPATKCKLMNVCIVSDEHIFLPTLDCEEKGAAVGIKGGHFSPNTPCPFSVCVPTWLINDPRHYHDQIIKFEDNVSSPVVGVRSSTDRAVRSGAWTILYDVKNPLHKDQPSGNGTRREIKTLFPDCFKDSFIDYVKRLYELVNPLATTSAPVVVHDPLGDVNISVEGVRSLNSNIEMITYKIIHPHLFGCRDQACRFSKENGTVCVTMYVRKERLGPNHVLTTITSMHPVD